MSASTSGERPNILFIMTDQQRFDTIAALGNQQIHTPNFDALVARGVTFTNGYSSCPVCVPARYTIRSGREPLSTGIFTNGSWRNSDDTVTMEARCGEFLPRVMAGRGYRTFGIGKSHTHPWDQDLGFESHQHSEELFADTDQRNRDAYAKFIRQEHPEYLWVEQLHGERTEMYYVPQTSSLPPELTVENWAAERAVVELGQEDQRPFFGMVSFIGPHPPCAPPIPYNRMYDPDRMPSPICGETEVDHADEQIPWMNRLIWADDISDQWARTLKSRYYGEISYIDACLGKIMDALERRDDADNTLVCFFADHGDHLGDHNAWQKESFFDVSCRVPFLVSWPRCLPAGNARDELVCLTDLFAIATGASGQVQPRDGMDLLGMLDGRVDPREHLFGYYGIPGTERFKIMVRSGRWKYIFLANGGREQLFDLKTDPSELINQLSEHPEVGVELRSAAIGALKALGGEAALDQKDLRSFPFKARPLRRITQFAEDLGVDGFPEHPGDVL
jgi:arylsulfatase A-like enzyme